MLFATELSYYECCCSNELLSAAARRVFFLKLFDCTVRPTVAAKPLGTLFLAIFFFKSLDEKTRNFGSEHFSTCPNFHYLDILLSLKYLRRFPLTRNVKLYADDFLGE